MGSRDAGAKPIRDLVIADPDLILGDREVMEALIARSDEYRGGNVVDIRGAAMDRIGGMLDELESTHRGTVAAAFANYSSTARVHRACLQILQHGQMRAHLKALGGDVAETLLVDRIALAMESDKPEYDPLAPYAGDVLVLAERGAAQRHAEAGAQGRVDKINLRAVQGAPAQFYGDAAAKIRSEACILLDFGDRRPPGMLLLGSADAGKFASGQGGDLLAFLAGVFEMDLRRRLA